MRAKGYLNRVVLALSLARLADALGNGSLFVLIPLYITTLPAIDLKLPLPLLIGILISVYGVTSALMQPLMGALGDRFGRRKWFIQAGLLLMASATLCFVFVSQFSDLLILRVLQGVGGAMAMSASIALMAAVTEKATRGGAMGFYTTMRVIGFAVGPLIGGFLQVHYGFEISFYVGAGLMFLAVILVQFMIREDPRRVVATSAGFRGLIDPRLLNAGILGASLAIFLMAANSSMMVTLENEFNQRLSQDALGFGFAFSSIMVGRILFQMPLGRLSDRIGRKPLIILGLILMAPATALLAAATTLQQLIGVRMIQGIAVAAIAAPAYALGADMSSEGEEGRQMSILAAGFMLGMALGPLAAGALAVYFFELPFLVGGVASLVGAGIVYLYVPQSSQGPLEREAPVSASK